MLGLLDSSHSSFRHLYDAIGLRLSRKVHTLGLLDNSITFSRHVVSLFDSWDCSFGHLDHAQRFGLNGSSFRQLDYAIAFSGNVLGLMVSYDSVFRHFDDALSILSLEHEIGLEA